MRGDFLVNRVPESGKPRSTAKADPAIASVARCRLPRRVDGGRRRVDDPAAPTAGHDRLSGESHRSGLRKPTRSPLKRRPAGSRRHSTRDSRERDARQRGGPSASPVHPDDGPAKPSSAGPEKLMRGEIFHC
jgi:hypothetical protein